MVAFWNSMPLPKNAASWRFSVPAGAPKGQQLVLAIGCAQCHGVTLDALRHGMAEVNGDWEWFKRQVYQETLTLALATPSTSLRSSIRWAKPAVKADQVVTFSFSRVSTKSFGSFGPFSR